MIETSGPSAHEKVGEAFSDADLLRARAKAWKALDETAAQIRPGHTEKDAALFLKEALKVNESEKIWHPPQIRFGVNTTKAFGERAEPDVVLQENDLFFLDIGPVFFNHEGDVGRTYVVGGDPKYLKIAKDAEAVFKATKEAWSKQKLSGADLYEFASARAKELGWELSLGGASGHRISDFPHAVHYRGKLKTQEFTPAPGRWILEIHLIDPSKRFGAFFEDLLDSELNV